MKIVSTAKRMLRGEVSVQTAALEAMRRLRVLRTRWRERAQFNELDRQPARLGEEFATVRAADLLAHFRSRVRPKFFPGFDNPAATARLQQEIFPAETKLLLDQAQRIADDHCWNLLGFGEKCLGKEQIHWNRDPLSGSDWPLDYHADIDLMRKDGSDARVVWELNRLAQLVSLGRAYAITNEDRFSEEFFRQLTSWRTQNPVVRGVNWSCAMEVALRIMNLLAAFTLFLHAPQMNPETLKELLRMFDQHGAHIKRNLEFSYLATSNHYLSDVAGLLWIGLMLPELEAAKEWRDFGLTELLNEMDKQVLPDGADHEAATGYHRLTLELFLYSFVLCHVNNIDIAERYWQKLRAMVDYLRAYLRPDGYAPLIGDSDSGQVLPIVRRRGDDHAYVLALGAAVFQEPRFKFIGSRMPEELLWVFGEQGVRDYQALPESEPPRSQAFPDAGTCVLRHDDLYLLFNASGSGMNGRGSHGHNDALSLEVSACGSDFIVDPGSYLYTADLHERHLFRSTAYHSTVEIDGVEQNTTNEAIPFVIGNEAHPRVISWESSAELDLVVAEHYGYRRLPQPVTHRRSVRFDKPKRNWLIEDELTGQGTHELSFRFHFAPGLETRIRPDGMVEVCDKMNGARLLIRGIALAGEPELESRYSSRDYGAKEPTATACWSARTALPFTARFALVPFRSDERDSERVAIASEARV
jgi:Heparinase II/III N-terminus/Heparinase II/III-like protein